MTSTEMLARVRSLLDEASASFWSDSEIYSALTDGQQSIANYFYNLYILRSSEKQDVPIPKVLEKLYTASSGTTATSNVAKPSGYWHLISAKYAYDDTIKYNCRIEKISSATFSNLDNTYLSATNTSPVIYEDYSASSVDFYFSPPPNVTAGYKIYYLKFPSAISGSSEPSLDVLVHDAIVDYAMFKLLMKDQRPNEAQVYLQKYLNELQTIGY
jgi:hypothetical protein